MKPLMIVGPTASGKTSLSYWIADQFENVDILVVDSKQVFRGQDIVTGKDLPKNFKLQTTHSVAGIPYYSDEKTRLFGIDLVDPNEQWSVAQFLSYAQAVYEQARLEDRFLIIVGGTPLYTLSLFQSPQTAVVTPNQDLREELALLSVEGLQSRLQKISKKRFERMNPSDQRNPRRLVRAIEVEISKRLRGGWLPSHQAASLPLLSILNTSDVCWVGVQVSKEETEARITARVQERIEEGAIEEFNQLSMTYSDWSKEAKSALGYAEIDAFLTQGQTIEELTKLWTLHEVQYAKRQMTWWKREKQIQWFDPRATNYKEQVLEFVKSCYNEKYA